MAAEAKDRAFILKWRSAVWASAVPASAKLCCLCLSEFADSNGSNCYPSLPTIASLTALNEKTVRLNLKLASAAGLIQQIAMGTSKGWKAHRYELQLPEGTDISRVRPEHGTDTTPVPSEHGTDNTPVASDPTCGHSVHKVRTLCPDGTGMVPTDLSITYPIPIEKQKRPQAASSSAVQLPDWISSQAWDGFVEARSQYPLTPHAAQLMLTALEKLRDVGQDPNACLDQSARNGWRDVFPVKPDALATRGKRPGESLADCSARLNAAHDRRERALHGQVAGGTLVDRVAGSNRQHDEREGRPW